MPTDLSRTGPGSRPNVISPVVHEFVRKQAPQAKYVLSVCTGSWILADAGVLDGKRATSNKAAFRDLVVSHFRADAAFTVYILLEHTGKYE